MNLEVAFDRLQAVVSERGSSAYVLTVSGDGRPHAVYLPFAWESGRLVTQVGNTTAANTEARPEISLLFPVRSAGDYSLFVDGRALVESRDGVNRLILTPARAVFHRHGAPADPASSCAADCIPVLETAAPLTIAPPLRDPRTSAGARGA